jgi:hypothetical protein
MMDHVRFWGKFPVALMAQPVELQCSLSALLVPILSWVFLLSHSPVARTLLAPLYEQQVM